MDLLFFHTPFFTSGLYANAQRGNHVGTVVTMAPNIEQPNVKLVVHWADLIVTAMIREVRVNVPV